ncbi:MAG: hypothetical protein J7M25_10675 [Deltaproteobacteria bacterium]|nr:hypothetical protein [Deltaproteobacteria bacterium]
MACWNSIILMALTVAAGAGRPAPIQDDWSQRLCPSDSAQGGTPLDPFSRLTMGPHSDLVERPGHFCGLDDEGILRRLRHGRIRSMRFNKGGLSISFRMGLQGTRALFKPTQVEQHSIPRKEIVAYRLNRLLGLSRVPPATARPVSMTTYYRNTDDGAALRHKMLAGLRLYDWSMHGTLSWWIPRIKFLQIHQPSLYSRWSRWLLAGRRIPPAGYERAGQISRMITFDFLMNNQDRFSGSNVVATPDGRHVYFMDNALSLFPNPTGRFRSRTIFLSIQRFSISLVQAIGHLTKQGLTKALAKEPNGCWTFLISPRELDALFHRRALIMNRVAELIIRYGWDQVMVFP